MSGPVDSARSAQDNGYTRTLDNTTDGRPRARSAHRERTARCRSGPQTSRWRPLKSSTQQIDLRETQRRAVSVCASVWNRPPRLPNSVPRAGTANRSPNGLTRFCSGMGWLYGVSKRDFGRRALPSSWPGLCRASTSFLPYRKTWMPGTRRGMTTRFNANGSWRARSRSCRRAARRASIRRRSAARSRRRRRWVPRGDEKLPGSQASRDRSSGRKTSWYRAAWCWGRTAQQVPPHRSTASSRTRRCAPIKGRRKPGSPRAGLSNNDRFILLSRLLVPSGRATGRAPAEQAKPTSRCPVWTKPPDFGSLHPTCLLRPHAHTLAHCTETKYGI